MKSKDKKDSKLRQIIKKEGITPTELAKKSGISDSSIARYLAGSTPKDTFQVKIINAINEIVGKEKYGTEDGF